MADAADCIGTSPDVAVGMQLHHHSMTMFCLRRRLLGNAELQHDNLITLWRVYEDSRYVHLIFELCDKDVLDELSGPKPVFESDVARILQGMVKAVQKLHSQGIAQPDVWQRVMHDVACAC